MKKRLGGTLILVGVLLLLASVGLVSYNTYDSARAGMESDRVLDELEGLIQQNPVPIPTHIQYIDVDDEGNETLVDELIYASPDESDATQSIPTVQVDDWKYIGVLQIPGLRLTLPVLHKWDYSRLRVAPCRYYGSVYTHDLVICGHNYSVHFSPVRSIWPGADVYFTDVYGTRYHYRVSKTETVQPTQVREMIHSDGEWELTLFTCNLGGATRFACRCQLIELQAPGQEAIPFQRGEQAEGLIYMPEKPEAEPAQPGQQGEEPAQSGQQGEEPVSGEQQGAEPVSEDQTDDRPSPAEPESNVPAPVEQVGT